MFSENAPYTAHCHHSMVSIDSDIDNGCSNCSNQHDEEHNGHQYNSSNNSSQSGMTHEECNLSCSDHHHQGDCSLSDNSISSSLSSSSHHHHSNCSGKPSWQEEDMKSSSYLSTCSRDCHQYNNNEHDFPSKKRKQFAHAKNAIQPTIHIDGDIKSSLASSEKRKQLTCCCGFHSRTTTTKLSVFFVFFIIVLGSATTFFCWPRTPRISLGGRVDSLSALSSSVDQRPSLRATWQINITLDNHDNWIPTRIKNLDFVLIDSLTLVKFAWASSGVMELPPGIVSPLSLTFHVNYQAYDDMDPTFQNLYHTCGGGGGGAGSLTPSDQQRPALNVLLKVYFHLFGIMWTPIVTVTPYTGGILCPIK